MRLFPEFATALICVGLLAGCQKSATTDKTTDNPASDQVQMNQPATAPAPMPSNSAAMNSNQSAAASAQASGTSSPSASAESQPAVKKTARHQKHSRTVARSNHKKHHRSNHSVSVTTQTPKAVATSDVPQADRQAERDEFKRDMRCRVANIGNAVSRYHNSASITDGLTRFEQKIEDVKIADALAKRQLESINTVSNENWSSFKSSFQDQVTQLERDYQGINQASR